MELDDENSKDLMDAFLDLRSEVETALLSLLKSWDDEVMNALFRAVHNVKGNAGLMGVMVIVEFTHEVEELVGALRTKRFGLSETIAETLLLAFDRLHDLHERELFDKKFDNLRLDELQVLFRAMSCATEEETNSIAQKIQQLASTAAVGVDDGFFCGKMNTGSAFIKCLEPQDAEERQYADLAFFQELALQLDNQLESWNGRSIQLFDWAMKMNLIAESPIK